MIAPELEEVLPANTPDKLFFKNLPIIKTIPLYGTIVLISTKLIPWHV
jgi:hypothetical protein